MTTKDESEPVLKPCPFCQEHLGEIDGSEPNLLRQHPENDCVLSGIGVPLDELERWNKRVPAPSEAPAQQEPVAYRTVDKNGEHPRLFNTEHEAKLDAVNFGDRILIQHLHLAPPASTGWLIENNDMSEPRWWHPEHGWVLDATKAQRFGREEDAQTELDITYPSWLHGKPTEHVFLGENAAPRPQPEAMRLLREAREAMQPFELFQRRLYIGGNCGPDSPRDFPDRWPLRIVAISGDEEMWPQSWHKCQDLTVKDFRVLDRVLTRIDAALAGSDGWQDISTAQKVPPKGDENAR